MASVLLTGWLCIELTLGRTWRLQPVLYKTIMHEVVGLSKFKLRKGQGLAPVNGAAKGPMKGERGILNN